MARTIGSYTDICGTIFGRLTVIEFAGRNKFGQLMWLCECSCENKTKRVIVGDSLRSGYTNSCGCIRSETMLKSRFKDLNGMTFGKLKILEIAGQDEKSGSFLWLCQCDCGSTPKVITGSSLSSETTTSCGCLRESKIATQLKKYYSENYNTILEYPILINPKTSYPLPYDIFLKDYDAFIEIQGGQHYEFVPFFHVNQDGFLYQKKKDRMKKKYAVDNGIFIEVDLRVVENYVQGIELINSFL